MGLIGATFFGIEPWLGCVVGASIALAYTVLGGLLADAMTDAVQFVIMCVSAAVAAAFVLVRIGGPEAIGARLGSEVLAPFGTLSVWELLVLPASQ
jgi:Na+/proline symporter